MPEIRVIVPDSLPNLTKDKLNSYPTNGKGLFTVVASSVGSLFALKTLVGTLTDEDILIYPKEENSLEVDVLLGEAVENVLEVAKAAVYRYYSEDNLLEHVLDESGGDLFQLGVSVEDIYAHFGIEFEPVTPAIVESSLPVESQSSSEVPEVASVSEEPAINYSRFEGDSESESARGSESESVAQSESISYSESTRGSESGGSFDLSSLHVDRDVDATSKASHGALPFDEVGVLDSDSLKTLINSAVSEALAPLGSLVSVKEELAIFDDRYKSLSEEYSSLLDDYNELVAKCNELDAHGVSSTGSSAELEEVLRQNSILVSTLDKASSFFHEDGSVKTVEEVTLPYLTKLEARFKEESSTAKTISDGIISSLKQRISELELQLNESDPSNLNLTIERLRAKVVELETVGGTGDLSALRSEVALLMADKSSLTALLAEETAKVTSLREELKELSDATPTVEALREELSKQEAESQETISRLETEVSRLDNNVTQLERMNAGLTTERDSLKATVADYNEMSDEVKRLTSENGTLTSTVERVTSELTSTKESLVKANQALASKGYVATQPSNDFPKKVGYDDVVKGSLFNSSQLDVSNIQFVFSGSNSSVKSSYLYIKSLVSKGLADVVLDLSAESELDFRLEIKEPSRSCLPWLFNKEPLSSCLFGNALVVGTMPFNSDSQWGIDWLGKLSELASLGKKVVVFGGSVSNSFAMDLFATVLPTKKVTVVTIATAPALRAYYFSSALVYGKELASNLLAGASKMDKSASSLYRQVVDRGYSFSQYGG